MRMKDLSKGDAPPRLGDRIVLLLIGAAATLWGIASLASGQTSYSSNWGGLNFAPIPLAFGALLIWFGVKRYRTNRKR